MIKETCTQLDTDRKELWEHRKAGGLYEDWKEYEVYGKFC